MKAIWRKAIIPIIMGACLMGCGNNQIRDERKTMNLNELGEIAVRIREEGSGTRQTFTESVVDSKNISEKCYEANGNDEVVEYVSENENAVENDFAKCSFNTSSNLFTIKINSTTQFDFCL